MLNKKRILILTLILAFLLTISGVSAVDDVTDDSVRLENQNDDIISEANGDVLKVAPKTFTDLNKAINGNTNKDIYLEYNYTFDSSTDSNFKEGININRAVTIHGNGYTIDGNSNAAIFRILNSDVILQDIIFANGKRTYDGGAVYGYSTSINCTFEDNSARDGGAIYLGDAVNCTFIGNSARDGGAIYEGGAVNCIFIDNYAHEEGGAILSYAGSFVNCTFINNSAEIGGAILSYEGSVLNCTFTGNYAEYGGGAIYGGANASNCIFTGNSAVYGGALHEGNACNCTFIGNYAENYGGAIYGGSAKACIFNENTAGVGGDNTYRTNMSKPVLSVSDFTSSYKSGEKLIVNLTVDEIPISNANVTIRVYKNNALVGTYYCLSGDGWVVNLDVGDYIADLSVENQEWDADSVNTTLKINKADTYINASDVPIVYTEDGELVACLINDAAGIGIGGANLRFAVGDEKYTVKTNLEGQAKLDISNLTPGTYTATVSYYGNVKYNPSNTTVIIVVNKVTTSISLYYDNATGELVVNLLMLRQEMELLELI